MLSSPRRLNGVGEVEIDAEAVPPTPRPSSHTDFGVAGGDVAGDEVAEAGVAAFQVVVALCFGDLVGGTPVAFVERHPDAAVVA